jgi:glycosyltransferase involved in cell wall biosynthesis
VATDARLALCVAVPVYNDRLNLDPLLARLRAALETVSGADWQVVIVDDGSIDGSTELLRAHVQRDPRFSAQVLSRNFGHMRPSARGWTPQRATR